MRSILTRFIGVLVMAVCFCCNSQAASGAGSDSISLVTLNCYWFLGQEDYKNADRPKSKEECELKAGHLVGLLPPEPPLFVGLQEVGNGGDVQALAYSARRR